MGEYPTKHVFVTNYRPESYSPQRGSTKNTFLFIQRREAKTGLRVLLKSIG
jgi:hypothetical protein